MSTAAQAQKVSFEIESFSRINWFDKLLIAAMIILTPLLFTGISSNYAVSIQKIDYEVGLMTAPQSQQYKRALDKISKAADIPIGFLGLKPIQVSAQLAVTVVANPFETLLRQALSSAIASLVEAAVSFILGKINQLFSAMEEFINGILGLRVNLGAIKQAMALQVYNAEACLNGMIDQAVNSIFPKLKALPLKTGCPGRSAPLTQLQKNAIFSDNPDYDPKNPASAAKDVATVQTLANMTANYAMKVGTTAAISDVQAGQNTSAATDDPSDLEKSKQDIKDLTVAASCNNDEIQDLFILRAQPNNCVAETETKVENELAIVKNKVETRIEKNFEQLNQTAPADCKNAFYISDNSLNGGGDVQNLLTAPDANTFATADFSTASFDADNLSFSTTALPNLGEQIVNTSNNFSVAALNKEQCDATSRLSTVVASAQVSTSSPSDNIGDVLVKTLKGVLDQIFDKLIKSVVSLISSAINRVLANIPYIGNKMAQLGSGLMNALSTSAESLKNQLISSI